MEIRFSAHDAYHHQYHVVWIPKYRKKILKGDLKGYLEKSLFTVQHFHPDVVIEKFSIQPDHVHLIIVIPPKYAVSATNQIQLRFGLPSDFERCYIWVTLPSHPLIEELEQFPMHPWSEDLLR